MKERKKILFLLHLPPPVHGSSIMGEVIEKSAILKSNFNPYFINILLSRTVKQSGKLNINKAIKVFKLWLKLFSTVRKEQIDLCYLALTTTGFALYRDFVFILLIKKYNIPLVYHLHNKGIKERENKKIDQLIYRYIFKDTQVILLSKHLYEDVRKFINIKDIHICPNGIEHQPITSDKTKGYKKRPFTLLFLSNLMEKKGVFDLIDACILLQKKGLDFNCEFIGGEGDINKTQFYQYIKRKGDIGKIHYLGKQFGEEKEKAYSRADIFVLPTYQDCFPLVIIEAMSHSLPIITTNEGGIPEMVENGVNGFIIEKGSISNLTEKIELLMNNPLSKEIMGRESRKKYENEFTLEVFQNNFVQILENITKKNNRNVE